MLEFKNSVQATSEQRPALHTIQEALSHTAVRPDAPAYLIGPNDERIPLPEPLFRILRQAAGMLFRGHRITLAPVDTFLSTQEAADMLHVSRPHLVKLLDDGVIAHTKAGRHRRVMFGDVVKYMNQRNAERRERLNKLIRDTEDAGLYDLEEFDLMPTR